MPSTNQQLADLFGQMAQVMQVLGEDSFRILAFQKVARVLEDLPQDVAAIGPDARKLTAIEGIGKGTAERIIEFVNTGAIAEHDQLMARIPMGLPELLNVPGLGPKTVALLWKQGGIKTLEDLKTRLRDNSLAQLPGLGAKKLDNLRKSLAFAQKGQQRFNIGKVLPVASWYVDQLRQVQGTQEVQYAGSLRRGLETIGDLDILVAAPPDSVAAPPDTAAAISKTFVELPGVAEVLGHGPTKSSIRTAQGLQVDLRVVEPASFGAAWLYFTGSKEHNVRLRQRAIDQGMKLNEYGLYRGESDKPVAGRTEEEVYKALGLAWIPPELREARDEIDRAEKGPLPKLIELADIKAELHAHTTASDGHWSITELAAAAADRGFHTIAVTDHSVSQVIARGLSAERLEQHIQEIRDAAAELKGKIAVLAGSEVDIKADGSLDYPNSLLKELDIVIASPHSALSQDSHKATTRLLKAIHNPYVTILGHPTGRLVGRREGISPDMGELVVAAAQRGIALEINAHSARLDLRDSHARAALEAGVKLAIDTDAHGPADLDQLVYGVLTARRAGATAGNVINCLGREALARWLKGTRP